MKKNVPLYDVILVGILIALVAYYFIVQGPIKQQTEELQIQKQEIETEILALEPSIQQKHVWEEELEKIYKKYNNNPISIPEYDNIDNIINEMHVYLDDCGFSINHGDITCEDNIVTRIIGITFTTNSYDVMRNKINAINNSGFKYQITDLSVTRNNDQTLTCSMKIVAYEYNSSGELK